MPNPTKEAFVSALKERVGGLTKLPNSNSLYEVGSGLARIYIRYSKLHDGNTAFYGLRQSDLRHLEGQAAFIVFLWDGQLEPLFVPFASYEEIFGSLEPASDGQYKAQLYLGADSVELYLARAGRFNLEGLTGWDQLLQIMRHNHAATLPDLTHSQVQSILSAIGNAKGYDIWVPQNNRAGLDSTLSGAFQLRAELPVPLAEIGDILQEIDVVWIGRGSNDLHGMFEVEHSTTIYSALLRFNDVHLVARQAGQTYRIIANGARRPQFVRQLNRPTFRSSGLNQLCTFLEYRNVYGWFKRICGCVPGATAKPSGFDKSPSGG